MSPGRLRIRDATLADRDSVTCLWREFRQETPELAWRAGGPDDHVRALVEAIGTDFVLLAEREGDPAGLAVAEVRDERVGYLHILFVRPVARRSGVAAALLREVATRFAQRGLDTLELDVLASNDRARLVYERWGLRTAELKLAAPVDGLIDRLT
jgi:ribosomal protein S18 acetylase RimI-like enzyme